MENNFRVLMPYKKGLPFIIIAMMAGYFTASKYLNYVTPMYEGTTKLRLVDAGEGAQNKNLFKDWDFFVSGSKTTAEIEVIKSDVLINKVLDELDFDIEIYRIGKIGSVELYDQSPIIIEGVNIQEDFCNRIIDLNVDKDNRFTLALDGESASGIMGDSVNLLGSVLKIRLNESLLKNNPNMKIADNYRFKILNRSTLVSQIQGNLDISLVEKEVPVIRINFKSNQPKKAALLPNKLAEMYIQDCIEVKYRTADQTVDFLNKQIDTTDAKLNGFEGQIQNFRDKKRITNLRQETETDLRAVSQMKIQKTNLEMNLAAVNELENYVKAGKNNFLELAPNFEAYSDMLSTEMVKKIKDLEAQKKDLLQVYTPEHDKVKVIDAKIGDLSDYITESITNTRKNLQVKYEQLNNDIYSAEGELSQVPANERVMNDLSRDFEIHQKSYVFLNDKKIEAEIAKAGNVAFHRILALAKIPTVPVSPNRTIIKIVSMLLAMIISILIVGVFSALRAKANDKESIEKESLIPIVSTTPKLDSIDAVQSHFLKTVALLELKGFLQSKSCIQFLSVRPNQGAAFNAYYFAEALALQKRNTLIIDTGNALGLTDKKAGAVDLLKSGLSVVRLDDPVYSQFSKEGLKNEVSKLMEGFDVTVILNEDTFSQLSMQTMPIAELNIVVLDSLKTPLKAVTAVENFKEEFKINDLYFLLNRYGYNPNLFSSIFSKAGHYVSIFKERKVSIAR